MSSPTINERIDTFLAAIAGEADAPDSADTHLEAWLAYILSKLGGSGDYAGLNGLTKWETLWENASPDSSFAAQTLTIDLSDYSFIIISHDITFSSSNGSQVKNEILKVGKKSFLFNFSENTQGIRNVIVNEDSIVFGVGLTSSLPVSSYSEYNSRCIPNAIIGVKVVS